jgi:TRF2-interacting telomeric protein/Rap1 - C terminal domain
MAALPDLEGVWTEEDDMLVLQRDARIMAELDRKHGWNASAERLKFQDVLQSTAAELRRKRRQRVRDDIE